jgi:hypothetical protein
MACGLLPKPHRSVDNQPPRRPTPAGSNSPSRRPVRPSFTRCGRRSPDCWAAGVNDAGIKGENVNNLLTNPIAEDSAGPPQPELINLRRAWIPCLPDPSLIFERFGQGPARLHFPDPRGLVPRRRHHPTPIRAELGGQDPGHWGPLQKRNCLPSCRPKRSAVSLRAVVRWRRNAI